MEPLEHRAATIARFATAWQEDADKIAERLASGWRPHLERAIGETFDAVASEHRHEIDALRTAHNRLLERLSQNLRRLRTFESESQWSGALADAAQLAAERVIIFSVNVDRLRFQAARGLEIGELAEIPLEQAPAFETAVTSMEPAVALKTRGELSKALAACVEEDAAVRFAVYPVVTRQRVPAVIYAEGAEAAVLDLIATAAGAALEGHRATPRSSPGGGVQDIVSIAPAGAGALPFVTRDEEERHSRALRFARVQVAEIRLYHSQAVKAGRAESNLYKALRPQIDDVRRVYQEQYLKNAPNMTDYLHQEIMRTLANGNSELLGPDYPGPLV